jgi:DME family drug/metabolite transporter
MKKRTEVKRAAQTGGAWLVLAAAVLWGTTGTSQALAPAGAQPVSIGTVRLVIGGLGLLAFAIARRTLTNPLRWPIRDTLAAGISMAAYQLLFFAGVARAGVAVGTIVGIGSSPILAGILGFFLRGERPGKIWGAATSLAIIGCALLVGAGSGFFQADRLQVDALGVLLAIAAGGSYALFTVASKGLLESRPPEAVMAVVFTLGALLLMPLLFFTDLRWLAVPRGIIVALHLGLVTVVLAYSLFAHGLNHVQAATAVTLTLAEPATAGLLGIFLLGESLTPLAFVGIGCIFLGLALLSVGNIQNESRASSRN